MTRSSVNIYFEYEVRTRQDQSQPFSEGNCSFFKDITKVTVDGVSLRPNGKIPYSALWQAEQAFINFFEEKYLDEKLISWSSFDEEHVILSKYELKSNRYSK